MRICTFNLILLLFISTGCETFNKINQNMKEVATRQNRERDEREAAEARAKQEAYNNKVSVLRAGCPKDELIQKWGHPNETALRDGKEYFWYENSGKPYIFVLKNSRVVEYYVDHQTIEKRNIAQEKEAERRRKALDESLESIKKGFSSSPGQFQQKKKKIRCRSIPGINETECEETDY